MTRLSSDHLLRTSLRTRTVHRAKRRGKNKTNKPRPMSSYRPPPRLPICTVPLGRYAPLSPGNQGPATHTHPLSASVFCVLQHERVITPPRTTKPAQSRIEPQSIKRYLAVTSTSATPTPSTLPSTPPFPSSVVSGVCCIPH